MTKRSKKNRGAKQPIPSQAAKQGMPRLAVVFVAIAVLFSAGFWWWNYRSAASAPKLQKLIGRWQRPDGGYVLAITRIADSGTMDAAYYNPKAIHVAKAEASRDGDATKVFIELRDVNHPGSTYTLTYDPAGDQLIGVYYQAVERQRFPVAFVRMK